MESIQPQAYSPFGIPELSGNDGQGSIELLPTAIYSCDANGVITSFNKAAEELWGQKPRLGDTIWCGQVKIFNPDGNEVQPEFCPMAIALKEQRAITGVEIILELTDGKLINVLPTATTVYDALGNFAGTINMLVNISHKKNEELFSELKYKSVSEVLERKVEERTLHLKQSEERYHKMVDEVQDYAILLLDPEGTIVNWNKGAEKIKGYTEKEILGKNFRIFYRDHDRESKLPETLIKQAHDTGRAMHEGWRLRKDGTAFWGSIVITALHDDDNNIIGFSKVTRDLTERKLADEQVAMYAKDIEFRNRQLEEYAYIASHDLQEPLRKIQVFAELLENNITNEGAARRHLDKINMAAKRMTSLIKDVLRYSQLSRADELFAEVDLNTTFEAIKEDFDLLTHQKSVTINHGNLPTIYGIPIQLNQLFSNLLSNAIKFNNGEPIIEIYANELTPEATANYPQLNKLHRYTRISFKDNGEGFDQQYGDQVFKMFKRLSTNPGTGIGLALCKKIVENHSGHIDVVSETGKGTTFTIILPIQNIPDVVL
ncbi:PAS domain S-box protein [Flavobacterium zepuense]|uniref:histidine kinase n=1 Tax=Flavobacterium zepuense TaxID=2593302 RepID=A0A552UWE3_9FLAO|nr:PAS domain S-box protein [Flavobacterium zepuense]TRW22527.1 PAS domain S-box protein [Flavobacterium zepuense]